MQRDPWQPNKAYNWITIKYMLYPLKLCSDVCQLFLNKTEVGNDYRLYELNYVKFWKRQEFGDSQRIRGCWGLEGGRGEQAECRDFRAVRLTWVLLWVADIMTLRKPTACPTQNANPSVDCGHLLAGVSVSFNQCATAMKIIMGGGDSR